jgi:hypothetical protein
MMYDWLSEQVAGVKWQRFFAFKRDAEPNAIASIERQFAVLPHDYKSFILRFGEARLFRCLDHPSYNLAVFARPRVLEGRKGETLLAIGFFVNGGYAHLRKPKGAAVVEAGVFEGAGLQVRKAAASFEEWLKKRFNSSKALYKKRDWRRIIEGAPPFTEEELRIVEAIKRFDFEKVGAAASGNTLIKVYNGSAIKLRYLSIGVRAKGRIEGGGYLDVSDIGPGESKVIEHDCYKSLVSSDKIELFRKPPPEPEDREMFYEFGAPEWMPKVRADEQSE